MDTLALIAELEDNTFLAKLTIYSRERVLRWQRIAALDESELLGYMAETRAAGKGSTCVIHRPGWNSGAPVVACRQGPRRAIIELH